MRFSNLCIVAAGVFLGQLFAQTTLNLEELSRAALNNNPRIKISQINIEISESQVDQSGVFPDPQFTYTWFGENVETRVGPQEQKFAIQQKVPWPGKLQSQSSVREKGIRVQKEIHLLNQSKVLLQTRLLWADLLSVQFAINQTDSAIHLLKQTESVLKTRYAVSKASYSRVLMVQNQIDLWIEKKNSLHTHRQNLLSTLFEITEMRVDIPNVISKNFAQEFMNLASQAGEQSLKLESSSAPTLKIPEAKRAVSEEKLKLAQKNFIPDFMFGFGYIQTGEAAGMPESGKDPWTLSVGLSLPIYPSKNKAKLQQSQLEAEVNTLELTQNRYSLQNYLEQNYRLILEAKRKRELFQSSIIPKVQQSLAVQESELQANSISFTELLESHRLLLDLQQKLFNSYVLEFKAKSKLLWLTGDTTPDFRFPYTESYSAPDNRARNQYSIEAGGN